MKTGEIYLDAQLNEEVEFRYMGKTGLAIVCEPGDSGGGMQSCWGINPKRLVCTKCRNPVATTDEIAIAETPE